MTDLMMLAVNVASNLAVSPMNCCSAISGETSDDWIDRLLSIVARRTVTRSRSRGSPIDIRESRSDTRAIPSSSDPDRGVGAILAMPAAPSSGVIVPSEPPYSSRCLQSSSVEVAHAATIAQSSGWIRR
jgi:hypothetical protein